MTRHQPTPAAADRRDRRMQLAGIMLLMVIVALLVVLTFWAVSQRNQTASQAKTLAEQVKDACAAGGKAAEELGSACQRAEKIARSPIGSPPPVVTVPGPTVSSTRVVVLPGRTSTVRTTVPGPTSTVVVTAPPQTETSTQTQVETSTTTATTTTTTTSTATTTSTQPGPTTTTTTTTTATPSPSPTPTSTTTPTPSPTPTCLLGAVCVP